MFEMLIALFVYGLAELLDLCHFIYSLFFLGSRSFNLII